VDEVILVDDGSRDETTRIARYRGLTLFVHHRNYGYGANQKTCYREALKAGADVVVMVHPDYQYDPTLLPEIVRPIQEGRADVVLGSRLLGGDPHEAGHAVVEVRIQPLPHGAGKLDLRLESRRIPHGLPAYYRAERWTRSTTNELGPVHHRPEIIAQFVARTCASREVPVPTTLFPAVIVGLVLAELALTAYRSFWSLARYILHRTGVWKRRQFESLHRRYQPEATLNHSVDASH
jgi:glycosyltransferase involved in cell wall biosynthesis